MQKQRVFLPGYVGCYVTAEGKVFNGGKEKVPIQKKGRAPQIRLQENNRTRTYGLATLMATHFLPNPNGYRKIRFLDGNHLNCHAANLHWVSGKEYMYDHLFRGKPPEEVENRRRAKEEGQRKKEAERVQKQKEKESLDKQAKTLLLIPPDPSALPVPGYEGYFASPSGVVWKEGRKLVPQHYCNKASRVKVKGEGGILSRPTVARLVALTFLSNPEGHNRLIFLDRNKQNPSSGNLAWVSEFSYRNWYRTEGSELLGEPKRKQKPVPAPVPHHPGTVPLSGYEGYYISPEGVVYKGSKQVSLIRRRGRSLRVKLRLPGTHPAACHTLGVATLVARHFIPNPQCRLHIIFKDRDNHNCCKDNIAWVDGETFLWYCGVTQKAEGRRKIVVDRDTAVQTAKHPLLRRYYKTGDEHWLTECWKEVEGSLRECRDWKDIQSECWCYFSDRARRYSILGDPTGLLLCYSKGVRARLRREISSRLPFRALVQTDESLRNMGKER